MGPSFGNKQLNARVNELSVGQLQDPNGVYISESIAAGFRSATESSYRLLARGLKYATSKLCENDNAKELDDLSRSIAESFKLIDKAQRSFQVAQESSLQHLNSAYQQRKSRPARSLMEFDLAKDQLKKMAEQNKIVFNQLNSIYAQLIKGERLYQRIRAECLLEDFKSIFGPGKAPIPEPEIPDDFHPETPDEFLDGLESSDPEINLLHFEID